MVTTQSSGSLVSVIVSSSGRLGPLRTFLGAVFKQTRPPWELIVVDSGRSAATSAYLSGAKDAAPMRVEVLPAPKERTLSAACSGAM
jgi:hypothetical protein